LLVQVWLEIVAVFKCPTHDVPLKQHTLGGIMGLMRCLTQLGNGMFGDASGGSEVFVAAVLICELPLPLGHTKLICCCNSSPTFVKLKNYSVWSPYFVYELFRFAY